MRKYVANGMPFSIVEIKVTFPQLLATDLRGGVSDIRTAQKTIYNFEM
jgi:hypothetical protein